MGAEHNIAYMPDGVAAVLRLCMQEGVCAVFVDPHFKLDAPGNEVRVAEVDPKKVMQVGGARACLNQTAAGTDGYK